MTLQERAENIRITYSDLREYVYVVGLLLKQVENSSVHMASISTLFGFVDQRAGELEINLRYLTENALN